MKNSYDGNIGLNLHLMQTPKDTSRSLCKYKWRMKSFSSVVCLYCLYLWKKKFSFISSEFKRKKFFFCCKWTFNLKNSLEKVFDVKENLLSF